MGFSERCVVAGEHYQRHLQLVDAWISAARAHLLLDDPDGLAFIAGVDSSTDTRPTSSWIVDERNEGVELVLCQVDMGAPTNDRLS